MLRSNTVRESLGLFLDLASGLRSKNEKGLSAYKILEARFLMK